MRLSWHYFFMRLAGLYALQSTCRRASVGCIIVKDNRQIGAGFNGSASGDEHCSSVQDCAVDGHCERSIHAEVNAVLQAMSLAPDRIQGATAYVTHYPCFNCFKVLSQVGISEIVYEKEYGKSSDAINRMINRRPAASKPLPSIVQIADKLGHQNGDPDDGRAN